MSTQRVKKSPAYRLGETSGGARVNSVASPLKCHQTLNSHLKRASVEARAGGGKGRAVERGAGEWRICRWAREEGTGRGARGSIAHDWRTAEGSSGERGERGGGPVDEFMLPPLDKVCELCLALSYYLVALHLRAAVSTQETLTATVRLIVEGGGEGGKLRMGRRGGAWRGEGACLDGLLLGIIVRDVPLGEAGLSLPVLQEQEADLACGGGGVVLSERWREGGEGEGGRGGGEEGRQDRWGL